MHTWAVVVAAPGHRIPPTATARLEDARSPDLVFPPERHATWSSADGRVRVASWSIGDDALEAGAPWEVRAGSLTAWSGHVWVDATPWAPGRSWAAHLADRYEHRDVAADLDRLDGIFSLLHLRDDGSGWVTTDPLGLSVVYRAEVAGLSVLSNRAVLAANLVTPAGRRPTRDSRAMASLAGIGFIPDGRTGFEAVRVLPQASVVRLHLDRPPTVETRSRTSWCNQDGVTGPAAVEHGIDRLLERVQLFASLPSRSHQCELTGGKDSRMVLALLLASGNARDFVFRTWGELSSADVRVATTLAERFDLTLLVDRKIVRQGSSSPARPGRPPRSRWRTRPLGYEESLRHHVWTTSAGLSTWDLMTVRWPPRPDVTLSGLFGEYLRTNHHRTDQLTSPALLRWGADIGAITFDAAKLLHPDIAEAVRRKAIETILGLVPPDGDVRDGVDGWYMQGRGRRWAGARLELDSRHRIFPLYDLATIRAGFAMGADARRDEELVLRIIERCAPELARMPFDHGGWPEGARARRSDDHQLPRAKPHLGSIPSPAELDALDRRRARHDRLPRWARRRGRARLRTPLSAPTVAEANRMVDLDDRREVMRGLLLEMPRQHLTWDLFDRRRTLAALDRIEELSTRARCQVHDALTGAIWLGGGEAPAPGLYELDPGVADGELPG